MRYRYWFALRPPMPGAVPKRNLENVTSFCKRTYRYEVNREVWGYADYSEPLTDKEVDEYDLVKGGVVHD